MDTKSFFKTDCEDHKNQQHRSILFCLSSHGFGHLTRTLAIIDRLLTLSEVQIFIMCGEKQIEFAKAYYEDRIIFESHRINFIVFDTDIGLINQENTLQVDLPLMNLSIKNFIHGLEKDVNVLSKELQTRYVDKKISGIITDISIVGPMLGENLNLPVIGLSNFTWFDQYKHLEIDQELLSSYLTWYRKMDKMLVYSLGLDQSSLGIPLEMVGFVAREIDDEKVEKIKFEYGRSIFVSCGKSASLSEMNIDYPEGTIFYTQGIKIKTNGRAIQLPIDIKDTQNYIAASELVISKAGWGTIAEAMIAGTPMVLMKRPEVLEDTWIIQRLEEMEMCISLMPEELALIRIYELKVAGSHIERTPAYNAALDISKLLIDELDL